MTEKKEDIKNIEGYEYIVTELKKELDYLDNKYTIPFALDTLRQLVEMLSDRIASDKGE